MNASGSVVVAGEALVDLLPGDGALVPVPGGSPFNVAVGLGRLGVRTSYLGALSTDAFGVLLEEQLAASGVDLMLAPRTDAPTTLAVVHLDAHQHATYGFYLAATSAAALDVAMLPILAADAALHVSFGAIGPDDEPTGRALVHLARREARRRVVSLDPNVRLTPGEDVDLRRQQVEALVPWCALVKASEDDLATLCPDDDPEATASRWSEVGPDLVVVTRGADGAVAFSPGGRVEVPAPAHEVVDTVGAGDAFTAGLLAALAQGQHLSPDAIGQLDVPTVTRALEHATRVAAITCTRAGADPPTAAEVAEDRAGG